MEVVNNQFKYEYPLSSRKKRPSSRALLIRPSYLSPLLGNETTATILKTSELITRADFYALQFVQASGIPCHYNHYLRAIVPDTVAYTCNQSCWKIFANIIRAKMGPFILTPDPTSALWENSAGTIDELLTDEALGATCLKRLTETITHSTGGIASFGPEDKNITKTKSSIESKIIRALRDGAPSENYAIRFIDDGVRGTIYFKTPKALGKGLVAFMAQAQKEGITLSVTDLWKVSYDCAGYADIELKIKIPLQTSKDAPTRYVLGEIQFHLDKFYDATPDSAVARAHKIYEILRMTEPRRLSKEIPVAYEEMMECSRLYFSAAMLQILLKT